MQLPGTTTRHLTYCLNIHPGESWAENLEAIRTTAMAVKARCAPSQPFGLGLRLGAQAAATLAAPPHLEAFGDLLRRQEMYVFTINGFPYGPFHGQAVKESVYRPDWRDDARRDYTLRLAEILAALLPEGGEGSISTLPVSYRAWMAALDAIPRAVAQLAACAFALHELAARCGREIHLGLEPEPDCLLQDTADSIDFFQRALWPLGTAWLVRERGCTPALAEALLRRHVGVCLDTCHVSLQFEELAASARALSAAGIRLSKVQLSAALRTPAGPDAARRLAAFVDPVYLHQFRLQRSDGSRVALPDLNPAALEACATATPADECRVHFHVPLHVADFDGVASTSGDLTPDFCRAAMAAGARHFEVETYTFHVLPPALRPPDLAASIAAELAWARARLG